VNVAAQHDAARFWLDRANEARLEAAEATDRNTMLELTALAQMYEKMAENSVNLSSRNQGTVP